MMIMMEKKESNSEMNARQTQHERNRKYTHTRTPAENG